MGVLLLVLTSLVGGIVGALEDLVMHDDWRRSGLAGLVGAAVNALVAYAIWKALGLSL